MTWMLPRAVEDDVGLLFTAGGSAGVILFAGTKACDNDMKKVANKMLVVRQ